LQRVDWIVLAKAEDQKLTACSFSYVTLEKMFLK
jgi:hypothetical protein